MMSAKSQTNRLFLNHEVREEHEEKTVFSFKFLMINFNYSFYPDCYMCIILLRVFVVNRIIKI